METKAAILARLQGEINALQGYKPHSFSVMDDRKLGAICDCFPGGIFPYNAVHEFCYTSNENFAATTGFVAGLASPLLQKQSAAGLWITTGASLFPPALSLFGVDAAKIFVLHGRREKDALWAVEEALKCKSLSAVFAEVPQLDFTASRRLQLAVEGSGVTCFLLRHNPRNLTTASTARWQISIAPTHITDGLPGIGYPHWKVELLKARNGKPGNWQVEWKGGKFHHFTNNTAVAMHYDWKRKAV